MFDSEAGPLSFAEIKSWIKFKTKEEILSKKSLKNFDEPTAPKIIENKKSLEIGIEMQKESLKEEKKKVLEYQNLVETQKRESIDQ